MTRPRSLLSVGSVLVACVALLVACGGQEDSASARTTTQSRWWAWAAAEPQGTDPVSDSTGENCGRNQPTDVWFLAGTFGGEVQRRCSVPAGRPVALPAINFFGTFHECDQFMRAAFGSVELDGDAVPLEGIHAEPVEFRGVAGNAIGMGSLVRATGCGLWARIPQLSPGTHHMRIRGQSGSFSTGADYTLDVAVAPTVSTSTH